MKKLFYISLVIFFGILSFTYSPTSETIVNKNFGVKVMTFNIRYANPNDGDNVWGNRKELVYDIIKKYKCDFVGTQEVLPKQLEDLEDNFAIV